MRVGIVSIYYNAFNYGAQLQARALVQIVKEYGYECEQICYDATDEKYPFEKSIKEKIKEQGLIYLMVSKFRYVVHGINVKQNNKKISNKISARKNKFHKYENKTAHSQRIYNKETISDCNDLYDVFITGSDQVFNPYYYNNAFLLGFVTGKTKLSYAASIGLSYLSQNEKELLQTSLRTFDGIAVREDSGQTILKEILPQKEIKTTIDPTLLIDSTYWINEAHKTRELEEPYIFCYFLGKEKKLRKFAEIVSKQLNLRILTIKDALGNYQSADEYHATELEDDGPGGFNSAIANACFVLTDSFHGTAFSIIHEKRFLSFRRNFHEENSGDSRIIDLLKNLGIEDRWVQNIEQSSTDLLINEIDYCDVKRRLEYLRMDSNGYLSKKLMDNK